LLDVFKSGKSIKGNPHLHKEKHVDKHGHIVTKYVNSEEEQKPNVKIKGEKQALPIKAHALDTFDDDTLTKEEIKKNKSPFSKLSKDEIKYIYEWNTHGLQKMEEYIQRVIFRTIGKAEYTRKPNVYYTSPNHYSIKTNRNQLSNATLSFLRKKHPTHGHFDEDAQSYILQETATDILKKITKFDVHDRIKWLQEHPPESIIASFQNFASNAVHSYFRDKNNSKNIHFEDSGFGDKDSNIPKVSSAEDIFFRSEEEKDSNKRQRELEEIARQIDEETKVESSKHPDREIGIKIINSNSRINEETKKRNTLIWDMYLNNLIEKNQPDHKAITEKLKELNFDVSNDTTRQVVKNITNKLNDYRENTKVSNSEREELSGQERVYSDPLSILISGKDSHVVLSPEYSKQLEEDGKPKPQIIPLKTLPAFNKQAHATLKSGHTDITNKNNNSIEAYRERGNVRVMYSVEDVSKKRNHYLVFYKRFADSDGNTTKIYSYTKKVVEKVTKPKEKEKAVGKKKPTTKKKQPVAKKKSVRKKVKKGRIWQGFVSQLSRR
jgi:hypothetical protein